MSAINLVAFWTKLFHKSICCWFNDLTHEHKFHLANVELCLRFIGCFFFFLNPDQGVNDKSYQLKVCVCVLCCPWKPSEKNETRDTANFHTKGSLFMLLCLFFFAVCCIFIIMFMGTNNVFQMMIYENKTCFSTLLYCEWLLIWFVFFRT